MFSKKLFSLASKSYSKFNSLSNFLTGSHISAQSGSTEAQKEFIHENNFNHNRQKIFFDENYGEKEYKAYDFYSQDNTRAVNTNGLILALPFLVIMQQKLSKVSCLIFNKKGPKRNQIEGRVVLVQYAANNPIEDRFSCQQMKNLDAFFVSVFDGHGGWQMAEFAMNTLGSEVDSALKDSLQEEGTMDEKISRSLEKAFDNVENKFLAVARKAYELGFSNPGRVGSCVLSVLVHNNKAYVANAGDSAGVLCKIERNEVKCVKVNKKYNAASKKEQARLKETFSTEPDVVVCRRGSKKACYVKNLLQPTRSFGDFRLKHPQFNNPKNFELDKGFPPRIPNFTGPYSTHKPDIRIFDLTSKDKYLILASDGLWDELSRDEVASIVEKNMGNRNQIAENLFKTALKKAAESSKMTVEELKQLPLGVRRKFHDDITILVVDLENQD